MDNRVFDLGNEVMNVVDQEVPSEFIPFRGNFPLLSPALEDLYYKEVASGKLMSEVHDWVSAIIFKGLKVKSIDDSFKEYLKTNGIFKEYPTMTDSEKSEVLEKFMDANCMTDEYLDI